MKILYFGDASWGAAALRQLVAAGREIAGVVLRVKPTDDELSQAAAELGLPVYQPPRCNAPDFLDLVRSLQPDLNLSVSYDQILRQPILDTAPRGFVNFHAGKLPWYRGRSVLNWTLINGEQEIGLTSHFVDQGIDTGDIILQRTLPVYWEDDYRSLLDRVVPQFPRLVVDTVELLACGNYERRKQSHLPGSYFPQRGPGDEWIDWNTPSRKIYNKIRGISAPGPGARSFLGEREIILWRASYDPDWPQYEATAGVVVGIEPDQGVRIKTADSTLVLQKVEYVDEPGQQRKPEFRIGTRFGVNLAQRVRELEEKVVESGTA